MDPSVGCGQGVLLSSGVSCRLNSKLQPQVAPLHSSPVQAELDQLPDLPLRLAGEGTSMLRGSTVPKQLGSLKKSRSNGFASRTSGAGSTLI